MVNDMNDKYYVFFPFDQELRGPMSFKSAIRVCDSTSKPTEVLVIVMDSNGKVVQ